jgi:hypothetical protein
MEEPESRPAPHLYSIGYKSKIYAKGYKMLQKVLSAVLFLIAAYWAYEIDINKNTAPFIAGGVLIVSFLSGFYLKIDK